ncbi:hypothetical protein Lal_00009561 [Lupinus albus]|nr:hypothetical protein Lal_00009561 [Lupinus albus]
MNVDKETYEGLNDGLYANLQTTKGNLIVKFEDKKAPVTVANFIGLAEGKIDNKAKAKGVPYYDGTIFHRVIKDFMIQGGDPQGTGMGDPGYKFEDERNDLKHTGKGVLSMANSGPNTNGSQFFITEVATPWLDGKHTIFGKVVKGEDVIDAIANVEKGAQDKPKTDIVLEKVSVFSKGDEYKNYDAAKTFTEGKAKIAENNKAFLAKEEAEKAKKEAEFKANQEKMVEDLKAGMQKTESGLYYKITKTTEGKAPKAGDNVSVHYAGKLVDGSEFDSSFKRNEPIEIPIGMGRVIKGWDEGILLLKEGETATLLIPPAMGYGERGAGGVIPPNAWLIFDVELVKTKANPEDAAIKQSLSYFVNTIKTKKIDQSVNCIYPKFFTVIPKDQMTQILNITYNNPFMKIEIQDLKFGNIAKPEQVDKEYFSIVNYFLKLKCNVGSLNEDMKKKIQAMLIQKYGKNNVQYAAKENSYLINANMKACAVSKDKKYWKFVILENEYKSQLVKVLPKKILDKI